MVKHCKANRGEILIKILIEIARKTPTGGLSRNAIGEIYANINTNFPTERTIYRLIQSINSFFSGDEDEKLITSVGTGLNLRYRCVRSIVPDTELKEDDITALLYSLYPQKEQAAGNEVRSAINNILKNHGDWRQVEGKMDRYLYISGSTSLRIKENLQNIKQLLHALQEHKRVKISRRLSSVRFAPRDEVEPLGLLYRDHEWYLAARSSEAGSSRVYRLDDIQELRIVENSRYCISETFSLRQQYGDRWNLTSTGDGELVKVGLKVKSPITVQFLFHQFHDSQQIISHIGGEMFVEYCIRDAREMVPWLMKWGATVEVLEPAWLRHEIVDVLQATMKLYEL